VDLSFIGIFYPEDEFAMIYGGAKSQLKRAVLSPSNMKSACWARREPGDKIVFVFISAIL